MKRFQLRLERVRSGATVRPSTTDGWKAPDGFCKTVTNVSCRWRRLAGIKSGRHMTRTRRSGKPPVPWLTPLILAVIASLAGLGLTSLRQDRRAAERDAEILAKALADSLARDCGI